jgi:hypothetical protein
VLGFASTVVMLTQLDLDAIVIGTGVVVAGGALALVLRRRPPQGPAASEATL